MDKLRIFLADDHAVVRAGLKTLVDAQSDMIVVGEADDGQSAVEQTRDCAADVVIMDISMPQLNGAAATAQLRQQCPVENRDNDGNANEQDSRRRHGAGG